MFCTGHTAQEQSRVGRYNANTVTCEIFNTISIQFPLSVPLSIKLPNEELFLYSQNVNSSPEEREGKRQSVFFPRWLPNTEGGKVAELV